jgi:hypothetical protein
MGCYAAYSHHAQRTWYLGFLIFVETNQGECEIMNMDFYEIVLLYGLPPHFSFPIRDQTTGRSRLYQHPPASTLSVNQERMHHHKSDVGNTTDF